MDSTVRRFEIRRVVFCQFFGHSSVVLSVMAPTFPHAQPSVTPKSIYRRQSIPHGLLKTRRSSNESDQKHTHEATKPQKNGIAVILLPIFCKYEDVRDVHATEKDECSPLQHESTPQKGLQHNCEDIKGVSELLPNKRAHPERGEVKHALKQTSCHYSYPQRRRSA